MLEPVESRLAGSPLTASMILRIDDVIAASKPKEETKGPEKKEEEEEKESTSEFD